MIIKVTRSSGKPFPEHQPIKAEYYLAFGLKTDFLLYEVDLYQALDIQANEEITVDFTVETGQPVKFVGVLYNIETLSRRMHVRIHLVSKYYGNLTTAVPLYGAGLTTDIISAFYKQAGIAKLAVDASNTTLQNVLFPRTTTRSEAIQYLLNRSAVSDGLLMTTVVGDTAYIRNNTKGKNDLRSIPYSVQSIEDQRKKVDFSGGLSSELVSDSSDVSTFESKKPGQSVSKLVAFRAVDNTEVARALTKVKQARTYYRGYQAVLTVLAWIPVLGSTVVVDKEDLYTTAIMPYLDTGKYFVHAQILTMDFAKKAESTTLKVQLVG